MRYLLAFCLLLAALAPAVAEDRDILIEQSNQHYDAGEHPDALMALLKAFAMEDGTDKEYYDAACLYALTDQPEKAMEALNTAVDKGWRNWRWPSADEDMKSIRGRTDFRELMKKTRELAEVDYEAKGYDMELLRQLEDIYLTDQTYRHLFIQAEEDFGPGSEESQLMMSLMINTDKENEKAITEILESRGWPGINEVGGRANAAVWLVIQHAPPETQEEYLPLLRQSVLDGNSTPRHLAMLEDRLRLAQGKKQIYGSQVESNDSGGWALSPLMKPEEVDQRRAEVGLGPLADYVKRFGIVFEVPQKP